MLGTEVEFSTWVSQALEIAYSGLFSASARRWLRTATSRVVIPNLARISLSCSDGFWGSMSPECTAMNPLTHPPCLVLVREAKRSGWRCGGTRELRGQDGAHVRGGATASGARPARPVRPQTARS